MSEFRHIPALLQQVIELLHIKPLALYVDGTLGGAGHTQEIIKKGGRVLGIDQDQDALEFVTSKMEEEIADGRLQLAHGNFRNIEELSKTNGFESVSGVLFDLGVSSYQLDTLERGFSIKGNERLDMRMDQHTNLSAWEVVNGYSAEELTNIFTRYGEDENAVVVAEEIVVSRGKQKINTTKELVDVIEQVIKKSGQYHPATKIFQAIRIEVNTELDSIKEGLRGAFNILDHKGRICVISFHSLEDRIVKQQFSNWEIENLGSTITKKPVTADTGEISQNPRARSAKLRVFEKK